ncbi:MAG: hypothetical protein ACLQU4_17645 [Limisphaerales bacterium]
MRYLILTLLVIGAAISATAKPSDYAELKSKPVDDLVLDVRVRKVDTTVYRTSPILYSWLTVTNSRGHVILPKDEYFCLARMFDSASNEVPRRATFKGLGSKFSELSYPSPEEPWSDRIQNVVRTRPAHVTGPSLWFGKQTMADSVFATQDLGEQREFYNLEDVFDLKRPGRYTVRLQFQAYASIYKGGQTFAYKLERFEPVEFTVTKE